MITIEQAFEFLDKNVLALGQETVTLDQAVGRVLAKPIFSDIDSPPHRKSVMDGFALQSADINQGIQRLKVIETIVAGGYPEKTVRSGEAARIMTGAPLPEGADSVVMIEKTKSEPQGAETFVQIQVDQISVGTNVVNRAGHFGVGHLLFSAGHRVRPPDVGLLAEVGAARLTVSVRPTVAILPTGDELVDASRLPQRGQIRNSNGPMLAAMARQLGVETALLPIALDNPQVLETAIGEALQRHDLVILTGGVSEGLLDLVPRALANLGVEEVFHKVRIKPGKPIWFGKFHKNPAPESQVTPETHFANRAKRGYVFGLPGNPVSSLVGFHLFVRTAVRLMEGLGSNAGGADSVSDNTLTDRIRFSGRPKCILAELAKDHETRGDRPTFWLGRWVAQHSAVCRVEPLQWRGSSDLLSLGQAEGLIYFSGEQLLTPAGSIVAFYPFECN
jgi:molybdopterin molybdotransferase